MINWKIRNDQDGNNCIELDAKTELEAAREALEKLGFNLLYEGELKKAVLNPQWDKVSTAISTVMEDAQRTMGMEDAMDLERELLDSICDFFPKDAPKPKVIMTILGGIPDVVELPDGVDVEIRDYDTDMYDGECEKRFKEDDNGETYYPREYSK